MKTRIAGAIANADGRSVTLYKEDGSTVVLSFDNYKTKAIMDQITPILARHKIAEIDLESFAVEREVEALSGGVIKMFWRKVKSKLFGSDDTAASPSLPVYNTDKGEKELVAVVNGKEIPGVERLERHMQRAVYGRNMKGFVRFMERLATVKRGHSVEDLLTFMQKADLPIADDGTIIAYKFLRCPSNDERMVDCHTQKVPQRIGSLVFMDESLVDPNRRNECSNGLHIARRGYLSSFRGDKLVMVKIAPEDVIAVPQHDPNKMRVRAYHIIFELDDEARRLLVQDKPMTTHPPAAKLLANAIEGNHIGVIEHVHIRAHLGGDVLVTPVGEQQRVELIDKQAKALDEDSADGGTTVRDLRSKLEAELEKAKAKAEPEIDMAAATGDMSAALNVREEPAKPKPAAPADNDRDERVMKLIRAGKTQAEVCAETGVSTRTIRRIVARNRT